MNCVIAIGVVARTCLPFPERTFAFRIALERNA